jgi:hypothetical protein
MITKETIETRRAGLVEQRIGFLARVNAVEGAINLCDVFLREISAAEAEKKEIGEMAERAKHVIDGLHEQIVAEDKAENPWAHPPLPPAPLPPMQEQAGWLNSDGTVNEAPDDTLRKARAA